MPLSARAAALFDIHLTPAQVTQFETYARLLVERNAHVNLTAITDGEGIEVKHFLDSWSVVRAVTPRVGMQMIDVGTGAGFPGVPLAIAFPNIHMTLMEATGKKVAFLQDVIAVLGLANCATLNARAEDAGHMPTQRAQYDVVLARAVARLPALAEYLLPLAKVGGLCIALKGVTAQSEARDARKALSLLGGKLQGIQMVALPTIADEHALVVIEKTTATPSAYPRKPGVPTRQPL
jgi:16S rRNA (guanine527-N7)-methyltransferase